MLSIAECRTVHRVDRVSVNVETISLTFTLEGSPKMYSLSLMGTNFLNEYYLLKDELYLPHTILYCFRWGKYYAFNK